MDLNPESITNPISLAAFALVFVGVLIARQGKARGPKWLLPTGVGMAVIALVGGLGIAFVESDRKAEGEARARASTESVRIEQNTKGGPAVAGVKGNVTITIDQPKED